MTQEKIDLLETYDLVIVHRSTGSGSFDETPEAWNQLQVPLLHGSAYLTRNSPARWNWVQGSQTRSQDTGFDIVDPNHPIVAGLSGDIYDTPLDIDHDIPNVH